MDIIDFIQKDDFYVIFDNGVVKESNFANNNDFIISKNGSYKIIYTNALSKQNLNVKVNENINADITEIYCNNSVDCLYDSKIELLNNAVVNFLTMRFVNSKINYNVKVILNKKSIFNQINVCKINGEATGNSIAELNSIFSKVDIKNIIVNESSKKQKHNFSIKHNSMDTESHLVNYAVCDKKSTLLVDNEGFVVENAERSNMNQITKGIILDLESEISANPVLKIDNYNVIANHGASIGAIGDDELFYLMSRGLTKEDSERLILSGYYAFVINEVKEEKIKDYILNNL